MNINKEIDIIDSITGVGISIMADTIEAMDMVVEVLVMTIGVVTIVREIEKVTKEVGEIEKMKGTAGREKIIVIEETAKTVIGVNLVLKAAADLRMISDTIISYMFQQ